ncbi:MAG: patatin-like phospholipase family protein, partial [Cyclobacteriaceae bacterium]|nr:patatin-like phospholipase family protein [Cyclobacteriaceae bacterium]
DNFGISDAVRFLFIFSDWISKNTSGVIFLSIRDSQKLHPVEERNAPSLFQKFYSPIQGLYGNFENTQDINNDNSLEHIQRWYPGNIKTVYLEYNSANNPNLKDRASLNWRLTSREKRSIIENILSEKNQSELKKLTRYLE